MQTIDTHMTNREILAELGSRLRGYRLQQNLTIAGLATRAGVGLRTVRRAEDEGLSSLSTLVAILRALGRLDALDAFLPRPLVSPIQMARLQGRVRERARSRKTVDPGSGA